MVDYDRVWGFYRVIVVRVLVVEVVVVLYRLVFYFGVLVGVEVVGGFGRCCRLGFFIDF